MDSGSNKDNMPDPHSSAMWEQFDVIDTQSKEQLEEDYQEIEEYNRRLLNQIAGLEHSEFKIIGEINNDSQIDTTSAPSIIKGRPFMSLLYLQPDRRQELMEQGEDPEFGNPHSIRGSVPERTKKLLDDLISGVEAIKDEARSTPELTVWRGNIGGEPIELDVYSQEIQLHKGSEVQRVPSLHVYACRPDEEQ